jgi:hypothetical protein
MSTQAEVSATTGPVPSGFNWGAFLFTGIFLFFNRRVGTALLLIVGGAILSAAMGDAGQLLLGVISMVVSLYFGFAAKQIAWETGRYATYKELEKSMRRWNIGALVATGALVVLVVLVSLQ